MVLTLEAEEEAAEDAAEDVGAAEEADEMAELEMEEEGTMDEEVELGMTLLLLLGAGELEDEVELEDGTAEEEGGRADEEEGRTEDEGAADEILEDSSTTSEEEGIDTIGGTCAMMTTSPSGKMKAKVCQREKEVFVCFFRVRLDDKISCADDD